MSEHHCEQCNRTFATSNALKQHLSLSPKHKPLLNDPQSSAYIVDCDSDDDFRYAEGMDWKNDNMSCPLCLALIRKVDKYKHLEDNHFYASCCKTWFEYRRDLHHHENDERFFCEDCGRTYDSCTSFQSHIMAQYKRARESKQARPYKCPRCPRRLQSPAAVLQHLESGSCPSKITRAIVDKYIARHDHENIITNPSRLLDSGPPDHHSSAPPFPTYAATDLAWDGQAFVCYFCPASFCKLASLDAHLNSPRHAKQDQKMYRCPGIECSMETGTMSGLVQHVESGRCNVRENRMVKDAMAGLTAQLGKLRLK